MNYARFNRHLQAHFLFVYLRAWANQNGLKKGTLVNLDVTSDGKLIVDSEYSVEQQPKVACLNVGPYLSREIVGRYLLGYDTIRIEAKDRIPYDVRNIVKSTVSSLIGLEIVEETSAAIVLQSLLSPLVLCLRKFCGAITLS